MITIKIECDDCKADVPREHGVHVEVIASGATTNFNFCNEECMCKYFVYGQKVNMNMDGDKTIIT